MAAGQPSFRLQVERARVRPRNSAFSFAMAATRATSIADKMHYYGFLITRAGTRATSLVDKMHFANSWNALVSGPGTRLSLWRWQQQARHL
jgi:hypothetical protein